jgi:hypothetical protein
MHKEPTPEYVLYLLVSYKLRTGGKVVGRHANCFGARYFWQRELTMALRQTRVSNLARELRRK